MERTQVRGGAVSDLVMHEATEPCRPEGCRCEEYGFPVECYRDSEAVKAYRAALVAAVGRDGA